MQLYRLPLIFVTTLLLSCGGPSQNDPVVIALVGDSTMTAEKGWGAAFTRVVGTRATVINFAASGRSAKSFLNENRLPAILKTAPDYVFIQFGHNGQPGKGAHRETDPDSTYRDFLGEYIRQIRAIGAQPIIVSSVTRRKFGADGHINSTLGPWAEAARQVAQQHDSPFIDLHRASIQLHNRIGQARSIAFNLAPDDLTHFNEIGSYAIAGLVLAELQRINHPLAALSPDSLIVGTGSTWPMKVQAPAVNSIASALAFAPTEGDAPFTIFIRDGHYKEKLNVDKPLVRLVGESKVGTIITNDDSGDSKDANGNLLGTRRSYTVQISASDFEARNLTIENSFDYSSNARLPEESPEKVRNPQGVALMLMHGSDRAVFRNVILNGNQDTLFVDAGRSYFHDTTIIGHVDFIFGAGQAVFEESTIASRNREQKNPTGYVTAPSTLADQPHGLLFVNSDFVRYEPTVPADSVKLGRPWHPGADPLVNGSAVFLNCFMDDHIATDGYAPISSRNATGERIWFDLDSKSRFYEYGTRGPGAHTGPRRPQLAADEIASNTIENVLGGWTP